MDFDLSSSRNQEELPMQKNYVQEILSIIHSGLPKAELAEKLSDYHEKDLADALEALTPAERQSLYSILGVDTVAEIFTYLRLDAEAGRLDEVEQIYPHTPVGEDVGVEAGDVGERAADQVLIAARAEDVVGDLRGLAVLSLGADAAG